LLGKRLIIVPSTVAEHLNARDTKGVEKELREEALCRDVCEGWSEQWCGASRVRFGGGGGMEEVCEFFVKSHIYRWSQSFWVLDRSTLQN